MNLDEILTDEQLILATSRSLPTDDAMDGQTAAARDHFLALGTAVEASASRFDHAALLVRLNAKRVARQPDLTVPAQHSSVPRWLQFLAAAALAASFFVAIARLSQQTDPSRKILMTDQRPSGNQQTIVPSASLAWTDPIDADIALAAAAIEQFSASARGFDGSLLDMNDRLDALSQELSGETL
jgi:hypothetical protein